MQRQSDKMTTSWINYGSAAAAQLQIQQNGAALLVDLPSAAHDDALVALATHLSSWAKSADVYALLLQAPGSSPTPPATRCASTAELEHLLKLIWQLDCFPKPLVSLLDAPLSALDIGLTTFGTHRVAGESYRFAIPPLSDLSALPVAGVAGALARLPQARGFELGLTGRTIGRAEAWAAGLVTHCIPASEFPSIIAALADGQPVDPMLDDLHRDPIAAYGEPDADMIERIFGAEQMAGIETALSQESSEWARRSLTTLKAQPPEISAAAHRLLRMAQGMEVDESLVATYRLASTSRRTKAIAGGEKKTESSIDELFLSPEFGDLLLPRRSEI